MKIAEAGKLPKHEVKVESKTGGWGQLRGHHWRLLKFQV